MPPRARGGSRAPVSFDPERYESWFETDLGRLVWEDERAALLPLLGLGRRRAAQAGASLSFVAGRVEALPFPGGSFDLVTAMTVLCFVSDPARAVRELSRVLRPGGRLVIAELGRWSLWTARRRLSGLFGNQRWKDARFWTPGSLERLTRGAGLDTVGRGSAVFYPPSATAARLFRPLEGRLAGRPVGLGAAFIAVAAELP